MRSQGRIFFVAIFSIVQPMAIITISVTRDHLLIAALNEEVQNLHAEIHPEIFKRFDREATTSAIGEFLADPLCICICSHLDDQPAGYLIAFIREVKENAFHYALRSIYIDQIAVRPEFKRKGIGQRLISEIEMVARERNIHRIELDHWSRNTMAAKWFRKNGFLLVKERLLKTI
jgi:diamine N-acetyltransferase